MPQVRKNNPYPWGAPKTENSGIPTGTRTISGGRKVAEIVKLREMEAMKNGNQKA